MGVCEELNISGWKISDTYFKYVKSHVQEDIGTQKEQDIFPILQQNIILQRNWFEPLIIDFIPYFVISLILFIIIINLERVNNGRDRGAYYLGISGLLFSLIAAHIKLRDHSQTAGLAYIEGYYILLYFAFIVTFVNRHFYSSDNSNFFVFDYSKNIYAKVFYWPVTTFCLLLWTFGLYFSS
jgi:hypothetical protein